MLFVYFALWPDSALISISYFPADSIFPTISVNAKMHQSLFFFLYTPPLIFNLAMHTSAVLARAGGKGNWPFNLQENLIIS